MSLTVEAVCTPGIAGGFRLAGLRPTEARDAEEGGRLLAELLDRPGVGVILVEEPCYDALPAAARRRVALRPLPLVVPFPAPRWAPRPPGPEAFIAELLRQAVGYRVRLG